MSYLDMSLPFFEADGYNGIEKEMTKVFDATQEFAKEENNLFKNLDQNDIAQLEKKNQKNVDVFTRGIPTPTDDEVFLSATSYWDEKNCSLSTKEENFDDENLGKSVKHCQDNNEILLDDTHSKIYRTTLIMHDFIGVTHLHSAKFIDTQRLPQLNFRINFLQQMKSGTEIDMVHHWIQGKKSAIHYNGFKIIRRLYEEIDSSLELFNSTKLAMEQASWEHRSLHLYHAQVCCSKKLDKKMAILIRETMKRLQYYRNNVKMYLFKAEEKFDLVDKELIKTTEATIATKRHEHEMLTAAAKLTEKKNRKFMKDVNGRTTGTLLAAATKLQNRELPGLQYSHCGILNTNTLNYKFDRTSGTFKEDEMKTSTENKNKAIKAMKKFDWTPPAEEELISIQDPNTFSAKTDRISSTFKKDEMVTSTENKNEAMEKMRKKWMPLHFEETAPKEIIVTGDGVPEIKKETDPIKLISIQDQKNTLSDKFDGTSGTLKEAEMLTSSKTQQLPMYEFCYPNTKIDEFDRTSGTFKENEILTSTSTKNQNEGVVKFDFDDAASEILRIENINTKIDDFDRTSGTFKEANKFSISDAAEALMNLAEQTPINKNTKTDMFDCASGTALTTEAKLASIGFIETIDGNFDETSGTDSEYESSNSDEWSDMASNQDEEISTDSPNENTVDNFDKTSGTSECTHKNTKLYRFDNTGCNYCSVIENIKIGVDNFDKTSGTLKKPTMLTSDEEKITASPIENAADNFDNTSGTSKSNHENTQVSDFRFDSTGCTALTAEAEAKLSSIENIKTAMDHNFDYASCTLKEDELLTSTEVIDLVSALTAEELASIEYFMKYLEGFDKTRGTLKQKKVLTSIEKEKITKEFQRAKDKCELVFQRTRDPGC